MVHRAEHESRLAQPAGQRDTDVRRLEQPAAHLGHQRQVQKVVGRVDHHDLGRRPGQLGQLPRGVETSETRPDDDHTVLSCDSAILVSPARSGGGCR